MTKRRRVLYDVQAGATYHCYQNCPLASGISEDRRRIVTEQIALDKGMRRCAACVSIESPDDNRPADLPLSGVNVEPAAKIGVALSGGGHRATLFGLGVLMYLVHARRNEDMSINNDVCEIASVSGGSIANGYVAQSLDYQWATTEEFNQVARQLASQISGHGTLFAPWWVRLYVAALVTVGILALSGLASVLVFRGCWSPSWTVVTVVSLFLVLVVGVLAQLRGALCEKAFVQSLFSVGGSSTRIGAIARSALHVICATEVQTGNTAYFSPDFVFCKSFKPRRPDDLQLATVVRASAALPLAFPPCQISARPDDSFRAVWRGNRRKPSGLLLVDGGVRDNLGANWFTDPARDQEFTFEAPDVTSAGAAGTPNPSRVLPFPEVNELVVVSAAANRIKPRRLHAHRPFLGELSSLLKLSELPYNTRELYSRRALLWRFASAPSLQSRDGRLRLSGAVLHIEESPCELAEALLLWSDNWGTAPSRRRSKLDAAWLRRKESDSATVETVDLLDWNALGDAIHRADAVLDAVAHAESEADLDKVAREDRAITLSIRQGQSLDEVQHRRPSKRELVRLAWARRAADNAAISTNLSRLGVETSASLMRHGFVLAMTKLHRLSFLV